VSFQVSDYASRWIKGLDIKMQLQSRKICLFIDNFSGHNIAYKPTNIRLEWFEPNLTSHIQPLDAGIIHCFKALYHRAFCLHALELDDAGEANIYKINLLEAMMMAKEAWDNVSSTTIQACWDHTRIQRAPIMIRIPTLPKPLNSRDKQAWSIIHNFATTDMTLPDTEMALKSLWGEDYIEDQWWPTLKAVIDAENDISVALSTVNKIQLTAGTILDPPLAPIATQTPQAYQTEQELMESVTELKK
jgi:DDE superfamily endonuclease